MFSILAGASGNRRAGFQISVCLGGNVLYKSVGPISLEEINVITMRHPRLFLGLSLGLLVVATGCAGPERKLGRGVNNLTEFARMGEIRRSVEQSALYEPNEVAYTSGFFRGFNRSMARTVVGAFEVLTFPIPSYEPYLKPGNSLIPDITEHPVYPDSYKPRLITDSAFETDRQMGFTGGDIAPIVPGSRFRIFDY